MGLSWRRFQHALGMDLHAQRRIGNLAVLLAALGVLGTGTGWPDVIVAAIMAGLAVQGAWVVLSQSWTEIRISTSPVPAK
jgi:Co/Zn/Cd efflux system component